MTALITGARGTLGSALSAHLSSKGHTVVAWDRQKVPLTSYEAMEAYLKEVRPDVLYHLAVPSRPTGLDNESWMVNYQWTSELAWLTRTLNIRFVYTSTVMVFSNQAKGPFGPQANADAGEGYGYEKRVAEERVQYQNPSSRIIRLGWQIGEGTGTNNMVDWLDARMRSEGLVTCSTQWLPACSYLADTVEILAGLPDLEPGLYHFDSNEKWSFYQIAFALNQVHGKRWKIIASDNFVYDQRMIDERLPRRSLAARLKGLK